MQIFPAKIQVKKNPSKRKEYNSLKLQFDGKYLLNLNFKKSRENGSCQNLFSILTEKERN